MVKPRWFDALFILRPTLFFPAWTFFLAGTSRGQSSGTFFLMIWLAAAIGASFLLNQLSDRQEDRLNEKLLPLWGELISPRLIRMELILLSVGMIAGAIWAGIELTFLLVLYLIIAGFFYNFRPLRLKSQPIGGIACCAAGAWIIYLIGARASGVSFSESLLFGFPYAVAAAAVTLLTHVLDLKGDRQSGIRTFPAVYGFTKTGVVAVILVSLCIILSVFFRDYVLLAASLISLPFFIRYSWQRDSESAGIAVKIAVFSLAVAVSIIWLTFLGMIVFYYFFARWYHRHRLGLDYPSFRSRITPVSSERYLKESQLEEVTPV